MGFIARLLLWIATLLGGIFAVWLYKPHWLGLPQVLDNPLVAFVCGSVVGYWLGRSVIVEPLEDFVAWLKGPTPLEQSRAKVKESMAEWDSCGNERTALEKKAGIWEVDSARFESPDWRTDSEVSEFGTEDDYRRFRESEDKALEKRRKSVERKAYFSVSELELRKMLIANSQQYERAVASYEWAKQDEAKAVVGEADAALKKARSLRIGWFVLACIFAVVLVYLAYEIFGQWAAIAAAVIAIFFGRYLEQASNLHREEEIRNARNAQEKATAELKDLIDSGPSRLKGRPLVFSEQEAKTGERDEVYEAGLRKYGHIL